MKTPTHRSVRLLFFMSALVLWLLATGSPSWAAAPDKRQHLASLDTVPEGLTPSDWASIRAAYEAQHHAAFPDAAKSQAGNSAQQAYLKPQSPDGIDEFGYSVAISGDTVVVGMPYEDSKARAIDGDPADDTSANAGAAYVFVRNGATWTQQAYLKAFNTPAPNSGGSGDWFGTSVAISGDTIVVGAPFEDSSATGVNGDPNNDNAVDSGAAYVFIRNGTTWQQQAYLKATNTGGTDYFGNSVAISGNTIVVGAPGENGGGANAGAAYVFTRGFVKPSGIFWTQHPLKASNPAGDAAFGTSVAISADTIVVGAPALSNGNSPGAAYVFLRGNGSWPQETQLGASNPSAGIQFGFSVAISGDTAVVGAPFEDGTAGNAGAAYVFFRNGTTWAQQAYLKASNPGQDDEFGSSVTISGDTVAVGAPAEDSNATGINGSQTTDTATQAGAVYVFIRSGATWFQQAYVKASNTNGAPDPVSYVRAGDQFGFSVAISGDTLIAGAVGEDSIAVGVNGNQDDNSSTSVGAAYVFTGFGPPTVLANISTRLAVQTGDKVLIGGFIITGTQPKKVIVRGIGPSLPLAGALANPILELHGPSGFATITNDNWKASPDMQAIIDSGVPPNSDLESAIVATLPAGGAGYTAIVRGTNNGTGIGAVEVFDLDRGVDSKLANISTRGLVQTGDNVLIAGTIVLGPGSQKAIIRALGPSVPVPGTMANPTLELHDANGAQLAANDNWRTGGQEAEIIATGVAPANDFESAIIYNLPAGSANYTAIVRGAGDTTGIAVVEIYALEP